MAVLLKHHGIGHLVVNLVSSCDQTLPPPPRCLVDICKIVQQARTTLIKVSYTRLVFVLLYYTCILLLLDVFRNTSIGNDFVQSCEM